MASRNAYSKYISTSSSFAVDRNGIVTVKITLTNTHPIKPQTIRNVTAYIYTDLDGRVLQMTSDEHFVLAGKVLDALRSQKRSSKTLTLTSYLDFSKLTSELITENDAQIVSINEQLGTVSKDLRKARILADDDESDPDVIVLATKVQELKTKRTIIQNKMIQDDKIAQLKLDIVFS